MKYSYWLSSFISLHCFVFFLAPADHGRPDVVKKAYSQSLKNLGLDFADLYLIHFPGTHRLSCENKRNTEIRLATWAALVDLYDNGLVNAIGVSNFTVYHLKQLMKNSHGVIPAVNQVYFISVILLITTITMHNYKVQLRCWRITNFDNFSKVEWHPFYHQSELLDFCKENDIALQAYCSLGGSSVNNDALLKHPCVTKIARKLDVTNGQVLLRWALQQDISVIPKATHPEYIRQNIALNFTIANEDMIILNDLGSHKIKYAWDPSIVV